MCKYAGETRLCGIVLVCKEEGLGIRNFTGYIVRGHIVRSHQNAENRTLSPLVHRRTD